mmetsp:Transcript_2537/g.4388  ORF Transcript_2537/g.4388 Transcript_2537/m.4388 type:complete len:215 (-) Transcript_2537:82-726(-)
MVVLCLENGTPSNPVLGGVAAFLPALGRSGHPPPAAPTHPVSVVAGSSLAPSHPESLRIRADWSSSESADTPPASPAVLRTRPATARALHSPPASGVRHPAPPVTFDSVPPTRRAPRNAASSLASGSRDRWDGHSSSSPRDTRKSPGTPWHSGAADIEASLRGVESFHGHSVASSCRGQRSRPRSLVGFQKLSSDPATPCGLVLVQAQTRSKIL